MFGVHKRKYSVSLLLANLEKKETQEVKESCLHSYVLLIFFATMTTRWVSSPGLLGRRLGGGLMMGFSNERLR